MGQTLRRVLLAITVTLGLGTIGTLFTATSAQASVAQTAVHTTSTAVDDDDDDDDDDDGGDDDGAPRGGVDTGVGGSAARDDDDDDDGAPRGGVDTGVGGSAARDDDDDDDGAPRGGVDTGMGGTAGGTTAESGASTSGKVVMTESAAGTASDGNDVPVVPLALAGAGLLGVGAYWLRRTFATGS
ncbi:hypothetical protein GCM10022224_073840 [Nonomuraea antimicrobica]|uniref:Uncharacterized protein n=1 Tax=Nonomuraea antimicrobica TaxID=561173 RepID=A0ABP7CVN7_9ACTN